MTAVIIRYTYPGTTNGKPVGDVYVQRVADIIPGYPENVYSYTKDPAAATTWPHEHAAAAANRYWRDARYVDPDSAEVLP